MRKDKLLYKLYVLILILVIAFQLAGCSLLNSENADDTKEEEIVKQYDDTIKGYEDEISKL